MEKQVSSKEIIIVGFALFAMFFGAGNLIFPTFLGFSYGDKWYISLIGFALTGVCLPLLGVIVTTKAGGTIEHVGNKAFPWFGKVFGLLIYIFVGILYVIPRTGATTYEMAVRPIVPGISPFVVAAIYFAINFFCAMNPTKVVDRIGKILTPILMISLLAMIIKGVVVPPGQAVASTASGAEVFVNSFLGGYQTGDALGGLIFTSLVVSSFVMMGYDDKKTQTKLTYKAAIVAVVGLLIIYGGLAYLGSTVSGIVDAGTEKTTLLVNIISMLLGTGGQMLLGLIVAFACLSTSIGVTSAAATMIENVTNKKLTYKSLVLGISVFCAIAAAKGVETLIMIATPIMLVCYPIAIAMVLMWLFEKYIPKEGFFRGAVCTTIVISIIDTCGMLGIKLGVASQLVSKIPLANFGFSWLLASIVGGVIGYIFHKIKVNNKNNAAAA